MKNIKFLLIVLLLPALTGCEKVIQLDLGNKTNELVIEANITNTGGPQMVRLSKDVPITNTNTYPPVTGATVVISDDKGNSYPATESSAGTYTLNATGLPGSTYTMNVSTEGKNYRAVSTMPGLVKLDSITTKLSDSDPKLREIVVHYQDPPGIVNQYRFVVFVNDKQLKAVYANDDDFNDGKYVRNDLEQPEDIEIRPGDKITVEMQCVDKPVHTYWLSLKQQQDNGPIGNAAPANPPTNISPTTFGLFSAHTTQTLTITAK
jgi:hypothetical protein